MNISSTANPLFLSRNTENNRQRENSDAIFASKKTGHAKSVKVYIKESFTHTDQSLINPAITNKIILHSFEIAGRTYSCICGEGADEYIKSLFQDKDDEISFVAKGQDGTAFEYRPPVAWGKRFVRWISQGASYCTTCEDSRGLQPSCHQFEHFLHCGVNKFSVKKVITCYNETIVNDIKTVKPFSYLNLSDTDTQEWIHSMTYIGSGFCIGKFGPGDIAIQTVENSLLHWRNKDCESPRSITLRTGLLYAGSNFGTFCTIT
ncbi:hypothetical protein [Endozoicomonas sp. SESOKO1]|uniref:hypothetical protein n=1 Tax=Endozoicomonas sp. SESOKO1 TaxID=2828742 RepID=UPI0021472391|nr:hypothetical protein [Endozoicomonas sp. SESOKO1]